MSLKTEITDGTGNSYSAQVTDRGELAVINSNTPPIQDVSDIKLFRQFFTDDGLRTGSNDMRVIGSLAAPLDFFIPASQDGDRYIDSISFVISDSGAGLNQFGTLPALTNGVELFYQDPTLGDVVVHDGIKSNFDLIRLCGKGAPMIGGTLNAYRADKVVGNSEGYIPILDFSEQFGIPWGIKLPKGSNLKLIIRVKDDTTGVDGFDAIVYGFDKIH